MDAAIAELIGSDGSSMYGRGGRAAGVVGPMGATSANVGGGLNVSAGVGANGTAIVLIIVIVGLVWFYAANRDMMR